MVKAIIINTKTIMYAREIPKLSPNKPNRNGAPAIAIPAASEALPIAKSGRL
jgi:DNA repair photolyase